MDNTRFLRAALRTNAAFSAASGVLAAAFSATVAGTLVIPLWVPQAVGVLLVAYGLALAALSAGRHAASRWTVLATALDLGWVVGSAALLAMHLVPSAAVVWFPAAAVFVLAALQLVGLRRAMFSGGTGRYALERTVQAPVDRAWLVVSDVARYAEVAGTLHRSVIVSGEGVGMVRQCEDTNGVCWLETCTRSEPDNAYAFEVDTSAPRYPLPLRTMRGDFEVEPLDSSRSIVRIRFTFTARGGWATELLLAVVFASSGDVLVGGILARWAKQIESAPSSVMKGNLADEGIVAS